MNVEKKTITDRYAATGTLGHQVPRAIKGPNESIDQPDNHSPVSFYSTVYSADHAIDWHRHDRAQLLYAVSGVMAVTTEIGRWSVPPQQAVWIPIETAHEVRMISPVSMRSIYVHADIAAEVQRDCTVVEVTPLLRELIIRLVTDETPNAHQVDRLMAVLIDEVKQLRAPPLLLPLPQDARLRKITEQLMRNSADERDLQAYSDTVGASTRTLARLFKRETGMGFRQWRQQLRLLQAIERLTTGEDVTSVALNLGYQSPSAFIAMFKRVLGTTPGQYLAGVDQSND